MRRVGQVVSALFAIGLVGCGEESVPVRIDENNGSFRSIEIGGDPAEARALGETCNHSNFTAPCGSDPQEITLPTVLPGQWEDTRYEEVTVYFRKGKVKAILIVDDDAVTAEGVQVGDPLDAAKERYPGLDCDVQTFEGVLSETVEGEEYCDSELSPGRRIIFGGDPIDSVVIGGRGIN
jgi:hypothetical protein